MGKSQLIQINDFHSTHLGNKRNLTIYLPEGYNDSSSIYPVLYMHDNQNLFCDAETGIYDTWKVNLTLDHLISEKQIQPIIIVGINSNKDRHKEFTHQPNHEQLTKDAAHDLKGDLYELFIIEEVMPYIQSHYRVSTHKENTAMIGSSLGGLVTFNIGTRNSHLFGKLGILSPALSFVNLDYYIYPPKVDVKMWIDTGDGEDLPDDTMRFVRGLIDCGYQYENDLLYYRVPHSIHAEEDWGNRLHMILKWFFGDVGEVNDLNLYASNEIAVKGF